MRKLTLGLRLDEKRTGFVKFVLNVSGGGVYKTLNDNDYVLKG